MRAAFFERCVIEVRIRPRVEYFGRERRGCGQIATDNVDFSTFQSAQQAFEAVDVHGFVQAVVQGLCNQWMIRNLAFADEVFGTCDLIGEHGREQILGFHAL